MDAYTVSSIVSSLNQTLIAKRKSEEASAGKSQKQRFIDTAHEIIRDANGDVNTIRIAYVTALVMSADLPSTDFETREAYEAELAILKQELIRLGVEPSWFEEAER